MNYSIDIFQIQENGGGTDIEEVSSSRLTYNPNTGDCDFLPREIGSPEVSLEVEEGVYAHGTMSLTADNIPSDYFSGYNDILNTPFVVVVHNLDTDETIFHGFVDPESTTYNPGTRLTNISIWSWDKILDAINTAGRTVYETQLFADFDYSIENPGSTALLQIPRYVGGDDLSTIVDVGDVFVFELPNGEHRGIAQSVTINTDDLEIVIDAPLTLDILASTTIAGADVDLVNIPVGPQNWKGFQFPVVDRETWGILASQETEVVVGIIEQTGGTKTPVGFLRDAPFDLFTWFLQNDQETVIFQVGSNDPALNADVKANGFDFELKQGSTAEAGTPVRILGGEVYGYQPVDTNANYEVDEIIEAQFSLLNTGVLRFIADTFTFPSGFSCSLPKWVELPANLLEALRQIQNTCTSFLKLIPSVDGSGLPRIEVATQVRQQTNTSSISPIAVSDVIEYVEHPADFTPAAVVVTPFVEYFKPKSEDDNIDTLGFYYDGVDSVNPVLSGRPSGPDVVELVVNVNPSYSGTLFTGEGIAVRNDVILRNIARRFYEFFQNLSQPCTFTLDEFRTDILGGFVTINEGGLMRTVFVTQVSYDIQSNRVVCSGLVGEYTDATTADPVAVITGTRVYRDLDDSGDEEITLSGLQSYDPLGGTLNYEWQVNPPSAPVGTGPTLQTTLAVGTHQVQLEVEKPVTLETDIVTITVEVLDDSAIDDNGEQAGAEFNTYYVSVDTGGSVYLTASGNAATLTTGGIKVETSTDDITYTEIGSSPFDNPQNDVEIATGLAEDDTLWIRVTVLNLDGTDGESRTTRVSNLGTPGNINADSIIVDDLTVQNSADFDLASGEQIDIDIDGNNVANIEETLLTVHVHSQLESTQLEDQGVDPAGSAGSSSLWATATEGLRTRIGTGNIKQITTCQISTSDPGVGDDVNDGYVVGDQWLNTTDGGFFVCEDNSVGAAVWTEH